MALLRIWVFGFWAFAAACSPLPLYGHLPHTAFLPAGFLTLIPQDWWTVLLTPGPLLMLKAGTVVACIAVAAGILTRPVAFVATVLVLLSEGIARGFAGYVNHAELPMMLAAVILTIGPLDHALTVWPRRRLEADPASYRLTLVAVLLMLCASYAFVGGYRLTHGAPAVFLSGSLDQWILWWSLRSPEPAATVGLWWTATPWAAALSSLAFPVITLLELSAPLCLLNRRFRQFFIPAMIATHVGIWLLMSISFLPQVVLYIVLVDSRAWSPVGREADRAVVWFDGFCGLCNRFVDFLLRIDRRRRLRFGPIQGTAAEGRFRAGDADPETIVFETGERLFERSDGVLQAMGRVGGAWTLSMYLGLVPRAVRDTVYRWVARNRYRWFGRRDACRLPTAEERAVFVEG